MSKILIVGDNKVGKTNLVNILSSKQFVEEEYKCNTTPVVTTKCNIKGHDVELIVVDSQYKTSFDVFKKDFNDTDIVIVMLDATEWNTVESTEDWWIPNIKNMNCAPYYIVCVNKIDIQDKREVSRKEGESFVGSNDSESEYNEISCKTGVGIEKLITNISLFIEIKKSDSQKLMDTIDLFSNKTQCLLEQKDSLIKHYRARSVKTQKMFDELKKKFDDFKQQLKLIVT